MARKSAVMLKSAPVKWLARDKKFIADARARTPEPGCEEQWNRYLAALEREADAEARLDVLYRQVEKEGGSSSCKTYPAFMEALKASAREGSSVYGAVIAYDYAVKHKDDKIGVPEEDVRAIVIDSLSDKLDGLMFSVNSGILGAKVAQAIRKDTIEESAGTPQFCSDCKED